MTVPRSMQVNFQQTRFRAGLSETLEGSDFTSVQERIELLRPGSTSFKRGAIEITLEDTVQPASLMPFQAEKFFNSGDHTRRFKKDICLYKASLTTPGLSNPG